MQYPVEQPNRKTSLIFIDIETVPSDYMPELDDIKAPANYKDPEKILAYKTESQIDAWKKQALDPVEGQILCLCAAVNDDPPVLFEGKESKILKDFEHWLIKMPYPSFVAHNGLSFDYRWLYLRSLKHGVRYLINTFSGTMKSNLHDTMKMLDGTGWNTMVSLDRAAKLIGIEGKQGMKGSDVFDYWQEDRLDEIYEYCKRDVELLRRLYYAIKGE